MEAEGGREHHGMCRHGGWGRMQAEVGSRKTPKAHKAEESLRHQVEGTELSRALRQKQGKNWVERILRRNQRQRTPAGR